MSLKPIQSIEAVEECDNINGNLIQIFDYAGNFRRSVGKDPIQLMWTFTRDAKPKEKAKTIPNSHPFIQYLDKLTNGELDTQVLYSYTLTFDSKKGPEINLYDRVTISRLGKKIETTVGRYIYNKVVFYQLWNNKYFDYINEVVNGDRFENACKLIGQLQIEKKCDKEIVGRVIDMNTEFGMRLSTMYDAGLTSSMMLPDDDFVDYRDKVINGVKDQVEKTTDLELLDKAEQDVIGYAKKHFKDDDMIEMYESGAKASWNNDFKNLQVNTGALPSLTGGKPTVMFNSLNQGIDPKDMPAWMNTGVFGAVNRGLKRSTLNRD